MTKIVYDLKQLELQLILCNPRKLTQDKNNLSWISLEVTFMNLQIFCRKKTFWVQNAKKWSKSLKPVRDDSKNKKVKNLGTWPKLGGPPPPHTTLGTQKFRNILLFEDPPPPHEFGNIDFGITLRPPN